MISFAGALKWLKNPLILGSIAVIVLVSVQEVRISNQKRKVVKLENKAYNLELDLRKCQKINDHNAKEFETLELEYYKITSYLETAKKNAEDVAAIVAHNEKIANDKIRDLQKLVKNDNSCVVSSHNIELLKAANNQN